MGSQLDINIARIAHLDLESALERVEQGGALPWHGGHPFPSYDACDLGLWLSRQRQTRHNLEQRDVLYQLVPIHEQFHQVAQKLLSDVRRATEQEVPKAGVLQQAWLEDREQMRSLSREIVFLLTSMELTFLDEQHKKGWQAHPLKHFMHRLFEGGSLAPEGDEGILDVSHARLVHLRWAENMLKAFRNRGRKVLLESADTCALGVWIHGVGLGKYAHVREMLALDRAHEAFHARAEDTIRALKRRQDQQAEHAYAAMQSFSREITFLLSNIENTLLDEASIRRTESFIR